jgi:hypothetical protein
MATLALLFKEFCALKAQYFFSFLIGFWLSPMRLSVKQRTFILQIEISFFFGQRIKQIVEKQ